MVACHPILIKENFLKTFPFCSWWFCPICSHEHYEEILNYFPNAQIETIDDAGHDVHVESRPVFVEKISAFLDKCLIN